MTTVSNRIYRRISLIRLDSIIMIIRSGIRCTVMTYIMIGFWTTFELRRFNFCGWRDSLPAVPLLILNRFNIPIIYINC